MTVLAAICLTLAAAPVLVYFRNRREFRPPPEPLAVPSAISLLIPARNEAHSIHDCLIAALASREVDLEVIVLDDHSTDSTAAIVRELAAREPRLRLESAPALPPGWSGKQHACHVLAGLATRPIFAWIDADVQLMPDALARMDAFRQASGAALVSGFPRQITGTLLEKLLIPLIHFVLLGFLPIHRMRASTNPGFGAGCGQFFLTSRDVYHQAGGHAVIRASFHDGVKLPRAYRRAGLMTDLCDATELATCRMYHSGRAVWDGLAKNAREGLGSPGLIWFWSILLLGGSVLPLILLPVAATSGHWLAAGLAGLAMAGLLAVRLDAASRFRQSWLSAFLHPLGVLLLVAIQWYATIRYWLGCPVGWKGRASIMAGFTQTSKSSSTA